jgi:hypothetical protein
MMRWDALDIGACERGVALGPTKIDAPSPALPSYETFPYATNSVVSYQTNLIEPMAISVTGFIPMAIFR